jgi:hypothetical protein
LISPRFKGAAALVFTTLLPCTVAAADGVRAEGVRGRLVGLIEDTSGSPVAGAVISLFGKGIGTTGVVTLSDSAGRVFLPAIPAGSYTLRALGEGHLPAPARQVTVVPDRDAVFTVSLTPVAEDGGVAGTATPETDAATAARELKWLVRHKRRSVLETRTQAVDTSEDAEGETPEVAGRGWGDDASDPEGVGSGLLLARRASWIPVDGSVEVLASPTSSPAEEPSDDGLPASFSALRLHGRIAESGRWSLGGVVGESEGTSWRMAAEFILQAGDGHQVTAGSGYGTRFLRPRSGLPNDLVDDRGVGAVFVEDRWQFAERATATLGARYSHFGFLLDQNHADPHFSIELQRDEQTRLRASVAATTLAPGGDLLTVSALSSGALLATAVLDERLRPERTTRYEVAIDQNLGTTTLSARTFYEGMRDHLVNAFEGPSAERVLRIGNGGGLGVRGLGLSLGRRFGSSVHGRVSYTYGQTWRGGDPVLSEQWVDVLPPMVGEFHDVTAQVETVIDWSDTRLIAYYRVNTLSPDDDEAVRQVQSRFDFQLSQGLPFLGGLTRADWEFLVAFRNLFYEASQGAVLDEVAVVNPPKRLLGGISVRF